MLTDVSIDVTIPNLVFSDRVRCRSVALIMLILACWLLVVINALAMNRPFFFKRSFGSNRTSVRFSCSTRVSIVVSENGGRVM